MMGLPEPYLKYSIGKVQFFRRFSHIGLYLRKTYAKEIDLTPTEYRLLYELVTHAEHILSSPYLLEKVWGSPHEEDTHLVWQAIHRLRQKIEADPSVPRYIHTRPGVGYVFTPVEDN